MICVECLSSRAQAHGGNDEDDDDDDDDDDGEIYFIGKLLSNGPPPAIAWFAEPQAEERRECEPRSASKPSVTAGNGGCRVKSAATRGRKRKTEEHQPR